MIETKREMMLKQLELSLEKIRRRTDDCILHSRCDNLELSEDGDIFGFPSELYSIMGDDGYDESFKR